MMFLGLDHFVGKDAGEIRLNGELLPGHLQSLSISGGLELDSARMADGSLNTQPVGYSPKKVNISLVLTSDPPGLVSFQVIAGGYDQPHISYGKAKLLDSLAERLDDDGNPIKWRLANPHTAARGIKEVWLTGLTTSEGHDDTVLVGIELTQVEVKGLAEAAGAGASQQNAQNNTLSLVDGDLP